MTPSPALLAPAPARLDTSAPGRVCLFGEHQDYLGLPVIACAIDMRVELRGARVPGRRWRVRMPDIGQQLEYDPNEAFAYRHGRDYLPSASNCMARAGIRWEAAYDVEVRGSVPINSGASSSSALQVAWCAFLLAAAGHPDASNPHRVATWAHQSEVTEFGSPGGMMDHFTSACGGVVWIDTLPPYRVEPLPNWIDALLLIDSGEPKDTNGVLARVKAPLERGGFIGLNGVHPRKRLESAAPVPDVDLARLVRANVENARITDEAREVIEHSRDAAALGALLTRHHEQLAQGLRISTPRIDSLLAAANGAGALGGKINGSGGGGTCFALCPPDASSIVAAIDAMGARNWLVRGAPGLRVEAAETRRA